MDGKSPKYLTFEEALKKMRRYCAYQDRCHWEARSRLLKLGVYGDRLEEVLAALVEENFLNEERFARSFVRGKFRLKGWGRRKLKVELKRRQISDYCIRSAMTEIDEKHYLDRLEGLLRRKQAGMLSEEALYLRKQRLARYGIRKGYESDLVWKLVEKLTTTA